MSNNYFAFKKFVIQQAQCAMKVTTDACLFGAWCATEISGEEHTGKKLLDIGTGTGLLSLMIHQKASLLIDAVEIDNETAAQAKQNMLAADAAEISVIAGDILKWAGNTYDFIVSNPPFYENELTSPSTTRSIAHHNGGLYWKDLCNVISDKLTPDGNFFLLIPYKRLLDMNAILESSGLFINKQIFVHHSELKPPTRVMIRGTKRAGTIAEEQLMIKEGEKYSDAFTSLLKEYYLYL